MDSTERDVMARLKSESRASEPIFRGAGRIVSIALLWSLLLAITSSIPDTALAQTQTTYVESLQTQFISDWNGTYYNSISDSWAALQAWTASPSGCAPNTTCTVDTFAPCAGNTGNIWNSPTNYCWPWKHVTSGGQIYEGTAGGIGNDAECPGGTALQ
jgi:hypothetical protein